MKLPNSPNCLLYFEPAKPADNNETNDDLSAFLDEKVNQFLKDQIQLKINKNHKPTMKYGSVGKDGSFNEFSRFHKGFKCFCGFESSNCDFEISPGYYTHSLCAHYLLRHRSEVPEFELFKLKRVYELENASITFRKKITSPGPSTSNNIQPANAQPDTPNIILVPDTQIPPVVVENNNNNNNNNDNTSQESRKRQLSEAAVFRKRLHEEDEKIKEQMVVETLRIEKEAEQRIRAEIERRVKEETEAEVKRIKREAKLKQMQSRIDIFEQIADQDIFSVRWGLIEHGFTSWYRRTAPDNINYNCLLEAATAIKDKIATKNPGLNLTFEIIKTKFRDSCVLNLTDGGTNTPIKMPEKTVDMWAASVEKHLLAFQVSLDNTNDDSITLDALIHRQKRTKVFFENNITDI
jgi:hypothetical protein